MSQAANHYVTWLVKDQIYEQTKFVQYKPFIVIKIINDYECVNNFHMDSFFANMIRIEI